MEKFTDKKLVCYHCGEQCRNKEIISDDHIFCCEGCKMVYEILNKSGLCDYYALNTQPGINRKLKVREDKFRFLDDEQMAARLISFKNEKEIHVEFYLPQIHCSSCLYLLESLHRLQPGILSSGIHFPRKEIHIIFDHQAISLRGVAELLTSIGYEPYISLRDMNHRKPRVRKRLIYQLGVAGFCFANIMLLSFPEYLGLSASEHALRSLFRTLNFILALPVFFFSAAPFFSSAWKSLRKHFLNIDAPISLAILITFSRSVYEILSGTGPGYFDSMSGIVFLMLAGRVLQERTYEQLSFDRDYSAYFPIAVSVLKNEEEIPTSLPAIRPGDTLIIHNEEIIPADGILTRGKGLIDYSFVTGESLPVARDIGEMIYAGGKQTGPNVEMLVMREVSQSNLTKLWNHDKKDESSEINKSSFVHLLSRHFTIIVFGIALLSAAYWMYVDPSRAWNAVTAVLIVACPCALLLSSSFTNGNILRVLSRNGFYLRHSQTIEDISHIDHFVFDKTGTLTVRDKQKIRYEGKMLTQKEREAFASLAGQSTHPLSVQLASYLEAGHRLDVTGFREIPGQGIEGFVDGNLIAIGSSDYISGISSGMDNATSVCISWEEQTIGRFIFHNQYRENLHDTIHWLRSRYRLSVLSGDLEGEAVNLRKIFGTNSILRFRQKPEDKLAFIRRLKNYGGKIAMIGDGLNDAVALGASDVGIAVTEDCNNFTPASDAILEAGKMHLLPAFISLCKANRKIILASFVLSIVYNIIGLYFAVQGQLSPLIAAILMPLSSLCILLITFGSTNLAAKWLKLR